MNINEHWMRAALTEAQKAFALGEVPVGAVVVSDGQIIASAHNEVESSNDPTAHAEMLALRRAAEKRGSWRLDDCELFVTLEPCTMCIGGILLSRISRLYFGAYDPKMGAVGSQFDLSQHSGLPRSVECIPELLGAESQALLERFFLQLRK